MNMFYVWYIQRLYIYMHMFETFRNAWCFRNISNVWTRCSNKPPLSHGWRIGGGCVQLQLSISEHLVLLSFNTSHITAMKYQHIHKFHTPQRRVHHVPVHWIQTPEILSGIPDLHRYPRVHHLRMESVLFRTSCGIISGRFLRIISASTGDLPEIPAYSCSIHTAKCPI